MAADEALLLDAAASRIATLRFYQWSDPTLSLGYFQSYDDRNQHAASADCAILRRQTGGGAILHDRELTYSVALPAAHPLSRNPQQIYTAVHDAFIAALQTLTAARKPAWTIRRLSQCPQQSTTREPFLCFARRACGDVLIEGDDRKESKVLGSAQRRHRGAILQHGSLLLERSPFAPELDGWLDLTGAELPLDTLIRSLTVRIAKALNLRTIACPFPEELQSKAEELANIKYGSSAWTKRR